MFPDHRITMCVCVSQYHCIVWQPGETISAGKWNPIPGIDSSTPGILEIGLPQGRLKPTGPVAEDIPFIPTTVRMSPLLRDAPIPQKINGKSGQNYKRARQ